MTRVGAMITRDLPPEDVPRLAASVAPGLDELWVVEDLGWAGGITQVAAVLDATANDHAGRPRVGHGIAPRARGGRIAVTTVLDGDMVKVFSWYDNEWGFSNRVVDALVKMT